MTVQTVFPSSTRPPSFFNPKLGPLEGQFERLPLFCESLIFPCKMMLSFVCNVCDTEVGIRTWMVHKICGIHPKKIFSCCQFRKQRPLLHHGRQAERPCSEFQSTVTTPFFPLQAPPCDWGQDSHSYQRDPTPDHPLNYAQPWVLIFQLELQVLHRKPQIKARHKQVIFHEAPALWTYLPATNRRATPPAHPTTGTSPNSCLSFFSSPSLSNLPLPLFFLFGSILFPRSIHLQLSITLAVDNASMSASRLRSLRSSKCCLTPMCQSSEEGNGGLFCNIGNCSLISTKHLLAKFSAIDRGLEKLADFRNRPVGFVAGAGPSSYFLYHRMAVKIYPGLVAVPLAAERCRPLELISCRPGSILPEDLGTSPRTLTLIKCSPGLYTKPSL